MSKGISVTHIDVLQYKHLTGEVRNWERKGDSGKNVKNGYCANCCTLMWVEADAMPELKIFKPGTLDDKSVLDKLPPVQEVYTKNRPSCISGFQDAEQKSTT